jgi:hypothetical protein
MDYVPMREAVEILKSVITPGLSGFSKYSKITGTPAGTIFSFSPADIHKTKSTVDDSNSIALLPQVLPQEQRPDDNAEDDFPPD